MMTAKRLYLYGVLAVVLLPLLVGLSDLLRLALDGLSDATGAQLLSGSGLALADLSLAIALAAVGAPLWAIHSWLPQRPRTPLTVPRVGNSMSRTCSPAGVKTRTRERTSSR